jgi:glycosyltransferase involved in cell wall biosynthesis
MIMNTISIILPFYNSEHFLGAMLASIAQQSEKDFELILINDASTDSSLQIAEQFVQNTVNQFKPIFISHTENRGLLGILFEGLARRRNPSLPLIRNSARTVFLTRAPILSNKSLLLCLSAVWNES